MKHTLFFSGHNAEELQYVFDHLQGIEETRLGFINGTTAFPTYEDVLFKASNHAFCVKVIFDDEALQLDDLIVAYLSYLELRKESKPEENNRIAVYYNDMLDGILANAEIEESDFSLAKIHVEKNCNFFSASLSHQHQGQHEELLIALGKKLNNLVKIA